MKTRGHIINGAWWCLICKVNPVDVDIELGTRCENCGVEFDNHRRGPVYYRPTAIEAMKEAVNDGITTS